MTTVERPRLWSDFGDSWLRLLVSGVFQGRASYECEFWYAEELRKFLDFLFESSGKPATSRLYRHKNIHPRKPEHYLSNLRFQFDAERGVAAAVIVVFDEDEEGNVSRFSWMTRGDAACDGVVLAHDSWNQHETMFPPESYVTIDQLRDVVLEWAFGERVLPSGVEWLPAPEVGWF